MAIHGLHVASRDALRVALREGASAFVLVHNHPSGDPTPSAEDLAFTPARSNAQAALSRHHPCSTTSSSLAAAPSRCSKRASSHREP